MNIALVLVEIVLHIVRIGAFGATLFWLGAAAWRGSGSDLRLALFAAVLWAAATLLAGVAGHVRVTYFPTLSDRLDAVRRAYSRRR